MKQTLLFLFFVIGIKVTAQTYDTKILNIDGVRYQSENTIYFNLNEGILSHTNGLNNYPIKFNRKEQEKNYFVYYFDADLTSSNYLNNPSIKKYGVRHFRLILDSEKNFLGFIEVKGSSSKYSILKYYP
ncbi:hypothetical protein ACK1KB_04025 [Chryseobacterium sp. TY3]